MWTPNENSIPPKHLKITILSQTMRAPRPMSRKGGLIATTGSQSGNSGRLRSSRPSIGNLDGKSKFEIRPIHMGENAPDWEGTNADADANMATRANIVFIILGEVIGCWKTREIIGRCIDGGVCVCACFMAIVECTKYLCTYHGVLRARWRRTEGYFFNFIRHSLMPHFFDVTERNVT